MRISFILFGMLWGCWMTSSCSVPTDHPSSESKRLMNDMEQSLQDSFEIATLGAGCFWCVEAVFQQLEGVHHVESGYSGGHTSNPNYKEVTSGSTGHAEVVQVYFDPAVISFEDILEVFWYSHDPTTLNRQGADVGTQYRSAIFYHSETQRQKAEFSKREVATQFWNYAIVTEITPFTSFWKAEGYHQDYYANNPQQGYCRAVIAPKVAKVRARYADRLKEAGKE